MMIEPLLVRELLISMYFMHAVRTVVLSPHVSAGSARHTYRLPQSTTCQNLFKLQCTTGADLPVMHTRLHASQQEKLLLRCVASVFLAAMHRMLQQKGRWSLAAWRAECFSKVAMVWMLAACVR